MTVNEGRQAGGAGSGSRWRSAPLASPTYDAVLFIGSPLLALLAAAMLWGISGPGTPVDLFGGATTAQALALRAIIHAHLVIVFARSHMNRAVFRRYPLRFIVVPVLLLAAMIASPVVLGAALAVVVVWDLYHSSMQTFGLARIYDARAGADVTRDRVADVWLSHAIYLGPFLAGPMLTVLVQVALAPVIPLFPAVAPVSDAMSAAAPHIRAATLVACALALAAYGLTAWRRARRGEPFSLQKHALYATTAIASVAAWGLNSFGQALLIVNLFHAVQYFGIVAFTEKKNLAELLGFARLASASALVFIVLVLAGGMYGFWIGAAWQHWVPGGFAQTLVLAIVNLVAILHFWYDGFIWSVRRGDV